MARPPRGARDIRLCRNEWGQSGDPEAGQPGARAPAPGPRRIVLGHRWAIAGPALGHVLGPAFLGHVLGPAFLGQRSWASVLGQCAWASVLGPTFWANVLGQCSGRAFLATQPHTISKEAMRWPNPTPPGSPIPSRRRSKPAALRSA